MITISACQRCSQLPPPPPIFSIGPPPNILSIDIRCSSRLLSSPSFLQHKKSTYSSSLSVSIALGMMIALLISTSTILLIKNRMIKRRQERQKRYDNSSSSDKFNGHNNHHHHHHNWTKFTPLLSDSCSSDPTLSTPASECPCGIVEPLLLDGIQHEYEQIKYDTSLHNYCLVYCRQCANYHQTNLIQSNYQHQCTCHLRTTDEHLFELQPMLRTTNDDLNHRLAF